MGGAGPAPAAAAAHPARGLPVAADRGAGDPRGAAGRPVVLRRPGPAPRDVRRPRGRPRARRRGRARAPRRHRRRRAAARPPPGTGSTCSRRGVSPWRTSTTSGWSTCRPSGRRTHAMYAAHLAFSDAVEPLVEHLLDAGEVRRSLEAVDAADPFGVPLETVIREVLSLCVAHSKSTVPAEALADRADLQRLIRGLVFTSMEAHRAAARTPTPSAKRRDAVRSGWRPASLTARRVRMAHGIRRAEGRSRGRRRRRGPGAAGRRRPAAARHGTAHLRRVRDLLRRPQRPGVCARFAPPTVGRRTSSRTTTCGGPGRPTS